MAYSDKRLLVITVFPNCFWLSAYIKPFCCWVLFCAPITKTKKLVKTACQTLSFQRRQPTTYLTCQTVSSDDQKRLGRENEMSVLCTGSWAQPEETKSAMSSIPSSTCRLRSPTRGKDPLLALERKQVGNWDVSYQHTQDTRLHGPRLQDTHVHEQQQQTVMFLWGAEGRQGQLSELCFLLNLNRFFRDKGNSLAPPRWISKAYRELQMYFVMVCMRQSKYQGSSPTQICHLCSASAGLELNRIDSLKYHWTTSPLSRKAGCTSARNWKGTARTSNFRSSGQSDVLMKTTQAILSSFLVNKKLESTAGQTQNLMLLGNKPCQSKLSFKTKSRNWSL